MKTMLKFGATWCGPCRQIAPVIDELIKEGHDIKNVDIDTEQSITQQYNIRSVPTLVILEDGVEIERIVGIASKEKIKELLS